jgi:proprotein convertase subtilisin/kexin type 5
MEFGIDELKGFLKPMLGCEYPCKECSATDPYHCTACHDNKKAPFLYWGEDEERQTCVEFCPHDKGYTSNGSRNPKMCSKCADTCQTCANNDLPGDIDVCETCKPTYPYLWVNRSSCHSSMCPEGSYKSNDFKCMSCNEPCKFCTGPLTCTDCFMQNPLKFLFLGNCTSKCVDGYTPIGNKCVKCNQPCATCKDE